MKKVYILLFALISTGAVFAQNHGKNDYQKDNKQWGYNQPDNNYSNRGYSNDDRYYNEKQQQMSERERRAATDRVNCEYDQRISNYRNDRSMNRYERDRRIAEAQRERQQKINSFGKGAVAGVIVGLIAGALFSHH